MEFVIFSSYPLYFWNLFVGLIRVQLCSNNFSRQQIPLWTNQKCACMLGAWYTSAPAYLPDPLSNFSEGLVPRLYLIKVPQSFSKCQKSDLMLGLPCWYVLCEQQMLCWLSSRMLSTGCVFRLHCYMVSHSCSDFGQPPLHVLSVLQREMSKHSESNPTPFWIPLNSLPMSILAVLL